MALKLLEGKSLEESYKQVSAVFVGTYVTGSVFWPAANMLNFMFVPPSGRVAYVNAAGLIWNAYLSLVNSAQKQAEEAVAAPAKAKGKEKK
jgi:protein Mpv17